MKTIRQIADEIGVSKQAVQKKILREPLKTNLQPYICTVDRTKYIDVVGERLIKSAYFQKDMDAAPDNVYIDNPTTDNHNVYSVLQETVSELRGQLKVKDRQIEELQKGNSELTQSLEHTTAALQTAQILHAGTMQKNLELSEKAVDKKKFSFFGLFKRGEDSENG